MISYVGLFRPPPWGLVGLQYPLWLRGLTILLKCNDYAFNNEKTSFICNEEQIDPRTL